MEETHGRYPPPAPRRACGRERHMAHSFVPLQGDKRNGDTPKRSHTATHGSPWIQRFAWLELPAPCCPEKITRRPDQNLPDPARSDPTRTKAPFDSPILARSKATAPQHPRSDPQPTRGRSVLVRLRSEAPDQIPPRSEPNQNRSGPNRPGATEPSIAPAQPGPYAHRCAGLQPINTAVISNERPRFSPSISPSIARRGRDWR